jgi:hypothetical protein
MSARTLFTSPCLRGEVRSPLAIRVRETIRESEYVASPPHPDPLRASYARLDPASGARENNQRGSPT